MQRSMIILLSLLAGFIAAAGTWLAMSLGENIMAWLKAARLRKQLEAERAAADAAAEAEGEEGGMA